MVPDNNNFWSNAAFWTGAVALLSFVLSKVYELAVKRNDFEQARQASIVRFKTDFKLRRDDLLLKREAYNSNDYKRRIVDLIQTHAADSKPFRLYGVELTDTKVQDEISSYLATFPETSQGLIRQAILRDRQMAALYRMMTTSAFEKLSADRQVEAFERWLVSVNELIASLESLYADMAHWAPDPNAWVYRLIRTSKAI